MSYRDQVLQQSDFDVEVCDIPDLDDDPVPMLEVTARSLLVPRLTARQRALQLMMTMGIVAMALCVVLGSSMPVRDLAARLLPGSLSMSAAVESPDVELFYIDRGLPWAHISLDGHPIAHLPAIGVDPPFRFTNGHHQLLWRADSFQ